MEADFINRFPWEDALLQEALDEEEWPEEAKVSYRPLQDQFKFWTANIVRDHLYPDETSRDFRDQQRCALTGATLISFELILQSKGVKGLEVKISISATPRWYSVYSWACLAFQVCLHLITISWVMKATIFVVLNWVNWVSQGSGSFRLNRSWELQHWLTMFSRGANWHYWRSCCQCAWVRARRK